MNGLSLLVALTALGVSTSVEMIGNQPTHVIRIESLLLEELRQGEKILAEVSAAHRNVRNFKIVVTPEKVYQPRTARDVPGRADSLVEYVAVQQGPEIELWVQIAPDRLITLAEGKAVEGQLPREVNQVHRFRVFVGADELPRQTVVTAGQIPQLGTQPGGGNYSLTSSAADPRSQYDAANVRGAAVGAQQSAANLPGSNSYLGSPSLSIPTDGSGNLAPLGPRSGATLRNSPDQSSAPPLLERPANNAMSPPLQQHVQDPQYNLSQSNPYPSYGVGAGIGAGNTSYNQPNTSSWSGQQYTNQGGMAPQQPILQPSQPIVAARPDSQLAQPQTGSWNNVPTGYANTQPPQQSLAQAPPMNTGPVFGAGVQVAAGQQVTPAATAPATQTVAAAPPAPAAETGPKSSTPLVLTTLALFTSLGVNTYLGWLAYSFFWRYREAVNDSVRARSYNAPGRQAA